MNVIARVCCLIGVSLASLHPLAVSAQDALWADAWQPSTPLLSDDQRRGLAGAALVEHKDQLVMLGGIGLVGTGGELRQAMHLLFFNTIQASGALSSAWQARPMTHRFRDHAMVSDDRYLYVVGGLSGTAVSSEEELQVSDQVYRLELDTREGSSTQDFTFVGRYPSPVETHAAVLVGQRLYVLGGAAPSEGALKAIREVYSIALDDLLPGRPAQPSDWRRESDLPRPMRWFSVEAYGDYLLVIGGEGATSGSTEILASVFRARIGNERVLGSWEEAGEMPMPQFLLRTMIEADELVVLPGATPTGKGESVYVGALTADAQVTAWRRESVVPQTSIRYMAAGYTRDAQHYRVLIGGSKNGTFDEQEDYRSDAFATRRTELGGSCSTRSACLLSGATCVGGQCCRTVCSNDALDCPDCSGNPTAKHPQSEPSDGNGASPKEATEETGGGGCGVITAARGGSPWWARFMPLLALASVLAFCRKRF